MARTTQFSFALLLAALTACSGEQKPAPTPAASAEPVAAEPVAADTAGVRAAEERFRTAMMHADTSALAALWAPEYLSTSAVGHTSNRAQSMMAYGTGLVKVDTAAIRELEIRPYGSTAVALGFMDWAGSAAGGAFFGTVRFQHVWVYTSGAWQLVASQLTNQPPAGSGGRPK